MKDDDGATPPAAAQQVAVSAQGQWRVRIRHACLGFGVVALLGAVSVGLFALLGASRPDCLESCRARTVAGAWGWPVVTASAMLLALAVAMRLWRGDNRAREYREDIVGTFALLYLVVVGLAAISMTPWTELQRALTLRPVTPQAPTVAAAVVLSILGAVALGLGRRGVFAEWKPVPRIAICGAGLAVVLVATVTIAAWSAGNDRRFVDASTAGGGGVPPAAPEFGERNFHIRLPDPPADAENSRLGVPVKILSAGTLFVLFDKDRGELVAYDFSGSQRWHYRRTGPDALRIFDAHAYDDGRTLVVALANSNAGPDAPRTFMGLDAVSGEQLWTRSGELLEEAFGFRYFVSPYLVARQKDSWTALDPRTGEQIWRVPNPDRCGDPGQIDGSLGLLVDVEVCQGDGAISYTLITVDAESGKVVRRQQLQRIEQGNGLIGVQKVERAGRDGVVVTMSWDDGRRVHTYANVVTGQVVELDAVYISSDDGSGGDFFTQSVSGVVRMVGADGIERCTFPFDVSPIGNGSDVGVVWFPQQLAYINAVDDKTYVRVADRNTCQILESLPILGEPLTLRVARGMTVLLSRDGGLYLTGYAS